MIIARDGAACVRLKKGQMQRPDASPARPAPLCAQLRGYSKAIFATGARTGRRMRRPARRMSARAGGNAEENIVAPAIGRYIAGANPPSRAPGPAALRRTPRIIGKVLPPRRVAAPGDADRTNRSGRVCRRDADQGIPRRDGPKRSRPQTQSAFFHTVPRRRPAAPKRPGRAPGSSAPMPKRMLIDATHPEETRVVVVNGTRLEEFDFESSTKTTGKRKHISRKSNPRRTLAAGGFYRLWRKPAWVPGVQRNPPGLLPHPGQRPIARHVLPGVVGRKRRPRPRQWRRQRRGCRRAACLGPAGAGAGPAERGRGRFEGDEADGEPPEEPALSGEAAFRERVRPDAPAWEDAPARAASTLTA